MTSEMTGDDAIRFLRGIEKKRGTDVEIVVKVRTNSGKVRRRAGRFLGMRNEVELGLRNESQGKDTWYLLTDVVDVWKKGARS